MNINKDINALINANVISQETAEKIQTYYDDKKNNSANPLFIVFGILGAILVGLGIILIIAHNWDTLSRPIKTSLVFLLVIIGQLICGFTLMKKQSSTAWRESSTVFLFLAIGACIALIGQIYHLPGNTERYLLTWMLLSLPLVYIMNSSMASLLYISGITWYACESGYWSHTASGPWIYWLLFAAALPHYYMLLRHRMETGFTGIHNWIVPLSLIITLGILADNNGQLMFITYISLFGLFYLAGNSRWFNRQKAVGNGFRILGILGTLALSLTLSFDWFWQELHATPFNPIRFFILPEGITATIISALAGILLHRNIKTNRLNPKEPVAYIFIFFFIAFFMGLATPQIVILINLIIFSASILMILDGAKNDKLESLNLGLLTITALIICRFFDVEISFVARGLIFILVGTGFFTANYWMLKKRNAHE